MQDSPLVATATAAAAATATATATANAVPPFSMKNRTRRASHGGAFGLNTELEQFLNTNANDAYKRQWHRLERGLRLNRIRKFVENEKMRMNLTDEDSAVLQGKLEKALDKKQLNSKTFVVYDQEKEEIQEIKGLVYHKTADGRILSSIVDKKSITFRKKPVKGEVAAPSQPVSDVQ